MVGQAAAPSAAIFLRSASAFYRKDIDGQPFTLLAPTRNVNDTLFVMKCGFGQNIVAPAGWTALPAYTNNNMQLFRRLATNTAADDFAITESSSRIVVGQMACFGNTLAETTLLAIYQSGALTNNTGGGGLTNFVVGDIPAGAFRANNLVIGWWMRERNFGVNATPTVITQPVFLANDIGSIAVNQSVGTVGRIYCGWEWQEEVGSQPLISGGNIVYSPVEDFSVTTSQIQRLEY